MAITTLDVLPKSIILNKAGDIVIGGVPTAGQNPRGKVLPLGPSGYVLGSNGQNPVWLPYSLTPGTVTSISVISPSLDLNITNSTITTNGTISIDLMPTGVAAGTYNYPNITVDNKGRISQISSGSSLGTKTITPKTTDYTILDSESGTYFTNEGAVGTVVFTLPDATAGLTYKFYVVSNNLLKIVASGSARIRNGVYTTEYNGFIQSSIIGSFVSIVAVNAIDWMVESCIDIWDNAGIFTMSDSGDLTVTYDMVTIEINKTISEITTITLPATPYVGETHTIKDVKGDASSYPITISGGSILIDNISTYVLNNDYQAIIVYYNGIGWNII